MSVLPAPTRKLKIGSVNNETQSNAKIITITKTNCFYADFLHRPDGNPQFKNLNLDGKKLERLK